VQKDSTTNAPAKIQLLDSFKWPAFIAGDFSPYWSENCWMDLHAHITYRGGVGALFLNAYTPGGD